MSLADYASGGLTAQNTSISPQNWSGYNVGPVTFGGQQQDWRQQQFAAALQTAQVRRTQMLDGRKPVIICGGAVHEAKDLDEAQTVAEALAHQHGTDAFILKPVRKVAPKRDVVTTELP